MNHAKRFWAVSACVFFLLAPTQPASAADPLEVLNLRVSREGDLEFSCGQLSQEALLMRDIIEITQDTRDNTEVTNTGIGVAGAVGSFLIGSVTGGIGLAAAGYVAKEMAEEEAEDAEGLQDIAFQRRALMMGIFNAKGCEGPIEHALQDREPQDPLTRLANIETQAGEEMHKPKKPRYNR